MISRIRCTMWLLLLYPPLFSLSRAVPLLLYVCVCVAVVRFQPLPHYHTYIPHTISYIRIVHTCTLLKRIECLLHYDSLHHSTAQHNRPHTSNVIAAIPASIII